MSGIAAERKEAKQEKDEAEKYKKLREDYSLSRLQIMLFKLFYTDKELGDIKFEIEVINYIDCVQISSLFSHNAGV